jgi:hypothetical protein
MYCTLMKVIMRGEGRGEQETKPRNTKEPWPTKSARGGQELEAHFTQTVKVKLCQRVGPLPQCTAAGSEQRLAPLCTSSDNENVLGRVGGRINTAMKQIDLVIHEILVILVCLGWRGYNVIDNVPMV